MNRILLQILFLILLCINFGQSDAKDRYWVFFSDKQGVEFDPYTYFDEKTIQKRALLGMSLSEYTDLPVKDDYISEVRKISGDVCVVSRWMNAVSINVSKYNLDKINQLPFVIKTIPVTMNAQPAAKKPFKPEINGYIDYLRTQQLESMGASFFENMGINGKGIRIAVFDGGFPGVDTSPVFNHLRENNQIIATWDFVKNREFVYSFNSHGTSVLTCIAGMLEEKKFGMATGSEFLLARTEVAREVLSEEENWLAAMEWADKHGADIINSSLGYTYHRYYQRQMDGHSTIVSRAASLAAAKGILVVNAAGNDGDNFWQVIGAPADADSILTVGGVQPAHGIRIHFSSIGPTYDGRLKPNVCAFGEVATSDAGKIKKAFGTSFAAPLVTGFAACVMQIHPEWNNMEVYNEVQKSGHLYPYFDYTHGYGVPQASCFTVNKTENEPSFFFSEDNDSLRIVFISEDYTEKDLYKEQDERQAHNNYPSGENNESISTSVVHNRYDADDMYMYFHIRKNKDNEILKRYAVVSIMPDTNYFSLPKNELEGNVVQVFFRGYSKEYTSK